MALTFTLPDEFDFNPGDGHVLNLSLQCVNSVDGRCRLRIMLGWFRFICGNGLVVGTARSSQRFIHNEFLGDTGEAGARQTVRAHQSGPGARQGGWQTLGASPARLNGEHAAEIARLRAQGVSGREIGRRLGISEGSVRRLAALVA